MAIARAGTDGSTYNSGTAVGSDSYTDTLATAAGNDRKKIICFSSEGSQDIATGVTYNGVAMTLALGYSHTGGSNRGEIWYIDEADLPASAGDYTVVITFAATTASWITEHSLELTGAETGGPEATSTTETTTTSIGGSITTVTNGAIVIGHAFGNDGGSHTYSADNANQVDDSRQTGSSGGCLHSQIVATAGSVTMGVTWNGTHSRHSNILAAFKEKGAGGGGGVGLSVPLSAVRQNTLLRM